MPEATNHHTPADLNAALLAACADYRAVNQDIATRVKTGGCPDATMGELSRRQDLALETLTALRPAEPPPELSAAQRAKLQAAYDAMLFRWAGDTPECEAAFSALCYLLGEPYPAAA